MKRPRALHLLGLGPSANLNLTFPTPRSQRKCLSSSITIVATQVISPPGTVLSRVMALANLNLNVPPGAVRSQKYQSLKSLPWSLVTRANLNLCFRTPRSQRTHQRLSATPSNLSPTKMSSMKPLPQKSWTPFSDRTPSTVWPSHSTSLVSSPRADKIICARNIQLTMPTSSQERSCAGNATKDSNFSV